MANIVIFGVKDLAELAHYYISADTPHRVVAFAIHREYREEDTFCGLPVVDFENINDIYPPKKYKLFAPMTGAKMNKLREKVFFEGKLKGYDFISYISSKATIFNGKIGENCFILENNTIQPFTSIGDNVVLWSGNHIGHHSIIKDHVFITSQIVISGHCVVESFSFIGVNASIRDGVKIGEGTFVAMSASIIKNTDPWYMYKGNPASKSKKLTKGF